MIDFSAYRDAQDCIGQACLTNSKRPESHIKGIYPTHVKRGLGARLFDYDDNGYLDFICGLGTNLLGYANPLLVGDLVNHIDRGFSHSLPTHYEIEAAQAIKSIIQFVDRVKFLKTGNEATNAAILMARAFTNRTLVYSDGYHGWGAEFTSLSEPAFGCPKANFIEKLPSIIPDLDGVAAVIVEPVICDFSDDRRSYLQALREACTKSGTVLIFDEVITGLRFPRFCVSQYFKVRPDLLVLGKALSGGLPLAAVCGPKEILDGNYFVSSTYAGEVLSLRACTKTIDILCRRPEFHIKVLWDAGQDFLTAFNALDPKVQIEGYPTRGRFIGDTHTKHLFFQEMCKSGVLFGPSWFYNYPLIEYKDHVINLAKDVFYKINSGQVRLEGEAPKSPFAEVVRNAARP